MALRDSPLVGGADLEAYNVGWCADLDDLRSRRVTMAGCHTPRQAGWRRSWCVESRNVHAEPFVWAKTADDIPASQGRYCVPASKSGYRLMGLQKQEIPNEMTKPGIELKIVKSFV